MIKSVLFVSGYAMVMLAGIRCKLPDSRESGHKISIPFRRRRRSVCLLPKDCRTLLALACTATWFVASCSRPADSTPEVTIEHEISPAPARIGPVVITLRLSDRAANAISGAHIALEADMSHAGMSPVFGEA